MVWQRRLGAGHLCILGAVVCAAGCASAVDDGGEGPLAEARLGVSPGEAKLTAGAGEVGFGTSLAVVTDTALVSWTNQLEGAADVFVSTGEGWIKEATLVPSDGTVGDQFGSSVALEGGTAIVGAFLGVDGGKKKGVAYVFVRDASGSWSEEAKLVASDGGGFDLFGRTVALSGDTAVVSAFQAEQKRGAAYVFVREGGVWSEQAKLVASDGEAHESFGISVGLSGETAVVGAYGDGEQGEASGSAYVYEREGVAWIERAKLLPDDGAPYDFFGDPVAVRGATVLIGSYTNNSAGGEKGGGAVYVYEREGEGWRQEAKLIPSDIGAADEFGISISLSSAGALIGSHYADAAGSNAGSAYLFSKCGGVWGQRMHLLGSDSAAGGEFGRAVSVSSDGRVMGVGAPLESNGTGSAYLFELAGGSLCEGGPSCSASGAGEDRKDVGSGPARGRPAPGAVVIPLEEPGVASSDDPAEETTGAGCKPLPVVPTVNSDPALAISPQPLLAGGGSACAISGDVPAAPRGLAALLLAAGAALARRRKPRPAGRSR